MFSDLMVPISEKKIIVYKMKIFIKYYISTCTSIASRIKGFDVMYFLYVSEADPK